ncbi:SDR family NAD(P)-dependent oxidoreductase [Yoonia vestfoldensis]|uniref:SDR family NAD(P)-dependent oxidoreductase n=1 Tax=Yoonia vestfoldensis TaxID=245188 RepID=UPI00039D66A3|nr:SDR family oxidoreductase [Yoonia vestfoldensis]
MTDLPRTPSFRLDGKVALVTGASSGIGFGAAVALAQAGAEVVMIARSADRLTATCADIVKADGKARAIAHDITDISGLQAMIAQEGPFDVLVNAAGMARHTPALDTTEDDFDAVATVNIKAAYFAAQSVARGLVQAGKTGSIIQISSQMGHVGGPDRAVYAATKHALEGMTKSMAIEWGAAGIRVNTICPTFILTPLTQATFADPVRRAWITDKIKLGRPGEVEDIMGAVVYLASEASALVTGTALRIDGGWTAE